MNERIKKIGFLITVNKLNIAYCNRLQYRAQGLISSGYDVILISLFPLEFINKYNIPITQISNYKRNIITLFWSLIKSVGIAKKLDYIIIDSTNIFMLIWHILFSKAFKKKILHEQTEFPFLGQGKNKIIIWLYKRICRKVDGIIVISDALASFYKSFGVEGKRIYKLPMLIDPSPFIGVNTLEAEEEYIAYCGDMGNNKDGIDDLIEAYSIFVETFSNIKLYLIGGTSDEAQYNSYVQKVSTKQLEKNVVFTGFVPHDQVPSYLSNAKILVLARPNNLQAQMGFPSKLGEYLATGKPVVITRTGEIDEYLYDNNDCFFVEPENPKAFANKLCEVIKNYDQALNVGRTGKHKVINEFNYMVQMDKMISYFEI